MKRYSIKKICLFLMIGLIITIFFYRIISNVPDFISNGYRRYKIEELELQNDLLLVQLGISREKIYLLSKNVKKMPENNDDIDCNVKNNVPCDVIHIGMVCANYKSSMSASTLFKSILFYRKNPLHFHIMVDNVAENILAELFNTWQLPFVNITFYSIKHSVYSVSWIMNNHYSGVYGLLKLTLPNVLPKNITKIIVLDTDLTFVSDISELWTFFNKFNAKQALGLVENQSNWYLKNLWGFQKPPWPAIGKGFNTGVILMRTDRLNKLEWSKLWKSVAEKTLITHGHTALADQDIFNTVIKQRPQIVYDLPCQYNIQLSDKTQSAKCYNKTDVKVIHWNSPRKHKVKNKDLDYFQSLYYTFAEYNGYFLRNTLIRCSKSEFFSEIYGARRFFQKLKDVKSRTHLFYREYKYEPKNSDIDITLVYQIRYNKIKNIESLSQHWEGPISVAIFGRDSEIAYLTDFIDESLILKDNYNIAYHVVYKEKNESINELQNILRKVAIKYIPTQYALILQEFDVPMIGLYTTLKKILNSKTFTKNQAFIIPKFTSLRKNLVFPKNKSEFVQILNENEQSFRFNDDNLTVDVNKWKSDTDPLALKIPVNSTISGGLLVPKYIEDIKIDDIYGTKSNFLTENILQSYDFTLLPNTFIIN